MRLGNSNRWRIRSVPKCYPCLRAGPAENGGADGIRTHDLLDAIEARSQLRHGPTGEIQFTTGTPLDMRSPITLTEVTCRPLYKSYP